MIKLIHFLLLCTVVLCLSQCTSKQDGTTMPQPTDTIVKMDGEDRPKRAAKEAWFELMHTAGQELDWKTIEHQNALNTLAYKKQLRKQNAAGTRDGEIVAEGRLSGTWREKGSVDQAGSILVTKYDVVEDMIYCVSAGGTLWRGGANGFSWEVINQDFRFSDNLLEVIRFDDGTKRIVAAINGLPHYSDDDGVTWENSNLIFATAGWRLFDYRRLSDGTMFVLQRANWNSNIRLYFSKDNGENWIQAEFFTSSDDRNYSMITPAHTDDLYIIEQRSASTSRLYKWDHELEDIAVERVTTAVGFGNNGRAILRGSYHTDSLFLYTVNADNEFLISKDTAASWIKINTLEKEMWNVGFEVLPSDPQRIFYGEVEAYRSRSGGKAFSYINRWWDYYGDEIFSLHADIMDIEEYTDPDGEPFLLISNHGGISKSTDGGETYFNLGLVGLNVSQYYSVRTHPRERRWVFAGSQDQGFQVSSFNSDGPESFRQVISGDYGHIVFSGPNDNLWTVYPWGSVSYYESPTNLGPTANYELESENESVWIPPLLGHPNRGVNAIYMAGGNINGGPGSHMIRLDMVNGEIVPSQFNFDFRAASGGEVSAMAISPWDHARIFVATTTGEIYRSTNGGLSFEAVEFGTPGSHWLYGSCILHSATNPDIVYLSGSGYSNPAVYVSRDGGDSFQPMNSGIPPTLAFGLAANEDESLIFAATEAGPYVYIRDEDRWFNLSGAGTPNQTYWSVEYIPETKTARFGTYGRGIWDFEVDELISNTEDDIAAIATLSIYPNPTANTIVVALPDDQKMQVAVVDPMGKVVQESSGTGKVAMDVTDLPAGNYFARVLVGGQLITKQFVKI